MKKSAFLMSGAAMVLATAAFAQPAVDLDLGTLTNPQTVTGDVIGFVGGDVKWVRFEIPAMARVNQQFLDITTNGGSLTGGDGHIGLFDAAGTFIKSNDDTGPGAYSQLSFGDTAPARAAIAATGNATGAGGTRAGIDGADLAAGVYYLAVVGYGGNTYANGWVVNTTHTRTGDVNVRVELGTDATMTSPTGVGSYPNGASVATGASAHFKVLVTNGANPASTYANVGSGVTVDGSLIGAGTIVLFDDGAHNDGAAGDGEWGADPVVPAAAGNYTLPFNIVDDQARTGTGNMPALQVVGPAPTCPPGSGSASFTNVSSAAAVGSAGNTVIPAASLNWTSTDPLLNLHVSGRLAEVNVGTYAGEATFLVTFADASTLVIDPFGTDGGYTGSVDKVDFMIAVPAGQSPSTVVSIEAYEAYDDGADGLTDSMWTSLCFTYDLAIFSPPTGVPSYSPVATVESGSSTHFKMMVTNGQGPASTFANVGSGVTVDGSLVGAGTVVLFDDGAHNDGAAGDSEWGADAVVTAAAGTYTLPYNILDDQGRSSASSMPVLTVIGPAPSCPSGSGSASFTNVSSAAAVGSAGNTVIPAASLNWTSTDPLLNFHVSGRIAEVNVGTWAGEATFLVTFADASTFIIDPFGTAGNYVGTSDMVDFSVAAPLGQSPSTVVSIEAVESYDDGADGLTDSMWTKVCFTYDLAVFTPPSGTGTGGNVGACGGDVLATVAVVPGGAPASTGLAVNLDTTSMGGGVVAMVDDGTNGDVTAGDNTFSATIAVSGGADANYTLPFAISDAQGRNAAGNLNISRVNDAGDLPASARAYYGTFPVASTISGTVSGNADSDMFAICVSDTANFEASVNNGGAGFDTQLFLFNPDGTGAVMNDDEPDPAGTLQSHLMVNNSLSGEAPIVLPTGGLYYLAIAGYDRDPITSPTITDTIWADQSPAATYDATWTPNGVTPAAPITGWNGTSLNNGGAFTITLVGATTICPADIANSGGATPDCAVDINDLLYFLTAFEAGTIDVADSSGMGVQDCATDINDLLFFLARFEAGC